MQVLIFVIFSTLLVGSLVILRDVPIVNGAVLASGAGERLSVRFLWPVLVLACLVLPCVVPGDFLSGTASGLFGPSTPSEILPVGMASVVAAMVAGRFSRNSAVPYSFIASLAGLALACNGQINTSLAVSYVLSWIAAPVLCALLAAGIYRLFALSPMSSLEGVSLIASFLLLAAFAVNYSLLFSFLSQSAPVSVPVKAAVAGCCAILLYYIMRKEVLMATWNIADYELDINSQSISSILLSMTLVLVLFSSPVPGMVGLAATPLPVGVLFVSALAGISVTRQRALVSAKDMAGTLASAVLTPVLAFMLSYCLAKVVDGTVIGTLFSLILALIVAGVVVFFRWQSGRDLQKEILRSRERQVYSTQKSLSALEVKVEMTEKDLLNKLDMKRKELVDFALGIGDQKRFMEKFYEELKEVRSMPDGTEKDAMTDALISEMRERMYFTSEMNDFYARSEVLHRDFNLRLSEAYPNLTENEKKLANLLRQGFSSKYIASLMNITPKSVEINRYRLRSKLGLSRSDNLIKFIKSI